MSAMLSSDATFSMEMFPFGHCPEGNGDVSSLCSSSRALRIFIEQSYDEVYGCLKGDSRNSGGKRLAISMVEEAWLSEKKERKNFSSKRKNVFVKEKRMFSSKRKNVLSKRKNVLSKRKNVFVEQKECIVEEKECFSRREKDVFVEEKRMFLSKAKECSSNEKKNVFSSEGKRMFRLKEKRIR
ncbi:hypothetical protein Tco_1084203 [Tanacetum coccineum]